MKLLILSLVASLTFKVSAAPMVNLTDRMAELHNRIANFDRAAGSALGAEFINADAHRVRSQILKILAPIRHHSISPEQLSAYGDLATQFNIEVSRLAKIKGGFLIRALPRKRGKIAHEIFLNYLDEKKIPHDYEFNSALRFVFLRNLSYAFTLIDHRAGGNPRFAPGNYADRLKESRNWRGRRIQAACDSILGESQREARDN